MQEAKHIGLTVLSLTLLFRRWPNRDGFRSKLTEKNSRRIRFGALEVGDGTSRNCTRPG